MGSNRSTHDTVCCLCHYGSGILEKRNQKYMSNFYDYNQLNCNFFSLINILYQTKILTNAKEDMRMRISCLLLFSF